VCARPPLPGPLLSTPKPSTNRRCALSVASLLDKTRLACTLDKHPNLRNTFNLHPPISGGPMGGRSRFLARCHRFHPSIRARNTCRKTRAEVYKALRFPQGRLSQASVQYFRSCKLLSLGTWSSCSLSSGSYELVTECLNSLPRNLGKRGRSEEGPPAPPAAEPGLYT
jgi:hypothetical protein